MTVRGTSATLAVDCPETHGGTAAPPQVASESDIEEGQECQPLSIGIAAIGPQEWCSARRLPVLNALFR
jgi:hypothetical protein